MEEFTPEESLDINQQEQEIELEDAIEKPNLSSIESKDPSLTDGLKIVYNKEVPMDLKLETKEGQKDIASFELIRVKVLSDSSSKETSPTCVKVELSSENDLLFHYTSIIDEGTFAKMKKLQNLKIEFSEYCELVEKICENCINSPDIYIGLFIIQKEGISKLQFVKGSDFKFLELLLIEFKGSSDEIIHKQMIYRFAYLKSKLEYDKKCIKMAGDIILENNPELLQPILDCNETYQIDVNKFFGKKLLEK